MNNFSFTNFDAGSMTPQEVRLIDLKDAVGFFWIVVVVFQIHAFGLLPSFFLLVQFTRDESRVHFH